MTEYLSHLRALERVAQVGSWRVTTGGRTLCADCSAQFLALHGLPGGAAPCDVASVLDRVHTDDREALRAAIENAFESGDDYALRYRIVRPDGTSRKVEASGFLVEEDAQAVLYGAVHDVTESELRVARLVAAESRFGVIVEHASEGILILNQDGVVTFLNRRASEILGRPLAELLGRRAGEFADDLPDDVSAERRSYFETRAVRGDGSAIWILAALGRLPERNGGGAVLIVSDITERKRIEHELREAADHDSLTGLMSRSRFEDVLDGLLSDSRDRGESLALLFVDLDQFKYVNDSFGHSAGDALLQELGTALPEMLREPDVVARFAGDEFVVVLPYASEEIARAVAKRLIDAIRARRWQSLSRITASVGVAVADPGRRTTREELLIAADTALRHAKESGRDRLEVYSGAGGSAFGWIDEIQSALDEDRFELYAQPIIPVAATAEPRYELLLRMVCDDESVVCPADFIPAAEQFGIIGEIDRWVVRRATEYAADGMTVEVNLSGASLGDEQILGTVRAAVAGGLAPERLIFEVTETAVAHNMKGAREFATALTALGCRFALDDFGTGFGSLTYLKYLPIDQVKIDIDFVRDVATSDEDRRLVCAIVRMADALGLTTVAEGVEDAAALEALTDIGVDFAQGFHLGRPRPLGGQTRSGEALSARSASAATRPPSAT